MSPLRALGQAQAMPSDGSSVPLLLSGFDYIRALMLEGSYAAAMEENAKLRQRLAALDVLVNWLVKPEDGVEA